MNAASLALGLDSTSTKPDKMRLLTASADDEEEGRDNNKVPAGFKQGNKLVLKETAYGANAGEIIASKRDAYSDEEISTWVAGRGKRIQNNNTRATQEPHIHELMRNSCCSSQISSNVL